MKSLEFTVYLIAGMSEETFSPVIMVDNPYDSIQTAYTWQELSEQGIKRVSDLIENVKTKNADIESKIGSYGMENFCYQNVYLKQKDYLIGLQEDKALNTIFEDFKSDTLSFAYLYVAGGASRHYMGFRFDVHLSREQIHANKPHVHVIHDDISVRYSLESFERFPQDKGSRFHEQHEKKRILPFIRNNKEELMDLWKLAMNGYIPPQIAEDGCQYCKES